MNAGNPTGQSVLIRPEAPTWNSLLRRGPWTAEQLRFREQVGLPTDKPIIMTGHQPIFWHCGVLAKYLAVDAASRKLGASPAWLIVDQDDVEPNVLAVPIKASDGRLQRRNVDLTIGGATGQEASTAIGAAVKQARERWLQAGDASRTIDRQTRVQGAFLDEIGLRAPLVLATVLARTELFQSWVDAMLADPRACIQSYNAAAEGRPEAGIRPLELSESAIELPLWRMDASGQPANRERVYAGQLASADWRARLAPRALLQTAILRAAGCDLFVHGTGGGGANEGAGYDQVMHAWLAMWNPRDARGQPLAASLAPMTVVTATRYLPLDAESAVSIADAQRARFEAHHARHNPGVLEDGASQERKRALLAQIGRRGKATRAVRREGYRALHAWLAEYREREVVGLARLQARADDYAMRSRDADVALDRTWPFILFPQSMLKDLAREINAAFGV